MSKPHSIAIPMYLNIGNEEIEIKALIEYTITPGCPERAPSYSSGGEPASPAEIEIMEVELEIAVWTEEQMTRFREPCPKWLSDYLAASADVRDRLGDHADWGKSSPDPDHERDRRLDDAIISRNSF